MRRGHGRYAPGFVAIAAVACLPPALTSGPGGEPDVPFLVAAAALAAAGLVAQRSRPRLDGRRRELIGLAVLAGGGGLLIALTVRSVLPAHDLLGHLAALQVTTSAIRRASERTAVQAVVVLATAVLLLRDVDLLDGVTLVGGVVGPVLLLTAVTALASTLAADLEQARRTAAATAARTAVRAELLDTVRSVAHAGPQQVYAATVDGLRDLGFDVAGVALLRGDVLDPEHVVGLRWERPLPVSHPQAQRVLASDVPLIHHDYRSSPDAIEGVDLGTLLLAPVLAEARPLGLLVAGRRTAGEPQEADVEIVDVLAAHLAAVLMTDRAERRQRELLARLRELESLRTAFVARVTDDLRDPLTVVRLAAQGLATRAAELDDDRRGRLAGALADQAAGLEATIESLLDFSRAEPLRGVAPRRIDVLELVAPALRGTRVEVRSRVRGAVAVDVPLLRRAIEVMRRAQLDPEQAVDIVHAPGGIAVELTLCRLDTLEGDTAWSVGEQLAVAAGAGVTRDADRVRLLLPHATTSAVGAP